MYVIARKSALVPEALPPNGRDDVAGPFTAEDIAQHVNSGTLDGLALTFCEGWPDWKELGQVEELKALMRKDEEAEEEEGAEAQVSKRKRKRKEAKENSSVFVEGLPEDVTEEMVVEHMKKAGVLKINPNTVKPHVKLYRHETTEKLLGTALVVYAKPESVQLAIKYLDDSFITTGHQIHVEEAKFDKAKKKVAPKVDKETLKKRRTAAQLEEKRLLSWAADTAAYSSTKKASRVIILSPCWTNEQAEMYKETSHFWRHIATLVTMNLEKCRADFKRVLPVARHPLGVVCIKFKTSEEAEALIIMCQKQGICLSPLATHPDYVDKATGDESVFKLTFYDGVSDLKSQCLTDEIDCFDKDDDLDAIDRLWLLAAGLRPDQLEAIAPAQAPVITREDEQQDAAKLDAYGDWLEAQSSDEEFAVKDEGEVDKDEGEVDK